MEKPRLIDVRSWSNAVHYLAQFPAEEYSQTPALSTSEALAKFTKLESLRIRVTEPDFFAWARKSHTSIAQGHTSHPTRSLRHVHLDGFDHNLIPSLVDLTRNFDSTLETLVVKSQFDSHSTQSTTTIVTKSLAWDRMLPSLRVIDLEGSIAVRFDYSCLQYCPNVTHLNFNIGRKIPADWNPLQDALLHIVQVPRLRALELAGYWDLTDEMLAETLVPALADKLQRLNLMWCRGPTAASIEAIMRGIRSLKWLGLSPDIGLPRDEILSMKQVFGREDLELDIISSFGSQ
ncbi:hypothetical protein BGW42_007028 [Actinomortierella wolfii]|nr:hypothetical protein BGW42_007028 [Actinomortierella wolfii]